MSDKIIAKDISSSHDLPKLLQAYSGYIEYLDKTIREYWEMNKEMFKDGEMHLDYTIEKPFEHALTVPLIPGVEGFIRNHRLYRYDSKEGALIKKDEPVTEMENDLLQDHYISSKMEKYKPDIENFADRSHEFHVRLNIWVDYSNGKKSFFGTKEGNDARTKFFKNSIAFYEDILVPVNKAPDVPYRYKEKSLNFDKEAHCFSFTVEYYPRKMFLGGAF